MGGSFVNMPNQPRMGLKVEPRSQPYNVTYVDYISNSTTRVVYYLSSFQDIMYGILFVNYTFCYVSNGCTT